MGEAANAHRKVGNLFDVKLRAIENCYAAGIDVCLVVTVVNTVNNDQVGSIVKFALENCDKISFVSFQPVSFTGRDEDISDEERHAKRYTLSHLAEDLKAQTGVTEPLRDWFPLSASSSLSDVTDLVKGPGADWGTLKCGCHPDCGIGTAFMVSKRTREWAPLGAFVNVEQFLKDARTIADSARGPALTKLQAALSLLRNYTPGKAPRGFRLIDLIKKYDKQSGGHLGGKARRQRERRPQAGRVAADVRRRDVVPGSLDVRLPAHRDVHHPLRHADGRDLVLRLQHRRGLAADRREDAPERDGCRVVQGARQARGLREPAQAGAARLQRPADHASHPARRQARRLAAVQTGGPREPDLLAEIEEPVR